MVGGAAADSESTPRRKQPSRHRRSRRRHLHHSDGLHEHEEPTIYYRRWGEINQRLLDLVQEVSRTAGTSPMDDSNLEASSLDAPLLHRTY